MLHLLNYRDNNLSKMLRWLHYNDNIFPYMLHWLHSRDNHLSNMLHWLHSRHNILGKKWFCRWNCWKNHRFYKHFGNLDRHCQTTTRIKRRFHQWNCWKTIGFVSILVLWVAHAKPQRKNGDGRGARLAVFSRCRHRCTW